MKHDETRALTPGSRGRGLHRGRLLDAAIVQPAVEAHRAEACVSQLASLTGVFDDRHDARPQPTHPGPEWQRRREGRGVRGEVARGFIEPAAEIRLHVGLTDERENVAVVHATQSADSAAPLVLHEPTENDIGARCHVALEPVAAPRTRDVRTVSALRDDPLQAVLGDDCLLYTSPSP